MSQSEYVNVAEAAALMAGVSKKLVYKLFSKGELLGVKIGALVRIRRSSVVAYLASHGNVKPTPVQPTPKKRRRQPIEDGLRFLG